MYTVIHRDCILNTLILTKLEESKHRQHRSQPCLPCGGAVPVDGCVLALGVHDADDDGVGVDVGRGAGVVTPVIRAHTGDLQEKCIMR